MKSRILLKEIPSSGEFHSAIFTTYSINLYFLEQQVLPLLGTKGIHYVSVLIDSNMLNAQLESYSILSEQRKRSYAIHGIQSAGAFHPKIIFLAGETSILVLLGSGNLTSSGHGKNLETWNAIYIKTNTDKKLGFALEVWNYLKSIHTDLGDAALRKIKTIEENCSLLVSTKQPKALNPYKITDDLTISFLANESTRSIYSGLLELVGNEKISRITIMSPYYDTEGGLIQMLNKQFNPKEVNVILQKEFGAPPLDLKPVANVRFYDWLSVRKTEFRQDYFHAKNIVFEGARRNFLLSGSANASVAAFGTKQKSGINHEACVLYQSKKVDFIDWISLDLEGEKSALKEFKEDSRIIDEQVSGNQHPIFIKAIEKSYEVITLKVESVKKLNDIRLTLFDAKGKIQYDGVLDLISGDNTIQVALEPGRSLLYGVFYNRTSVSFPEN